MFQAISEETQQKIKHCEVIGMSVTEIASITGVSKNCVRNHLNRKNKRRTIDAKVQQLANRIVKVTNMFEKVSLFDNVTVKKKASQSVRGKRIKTISGTIIYKDDHKFILQRTPWSRHTFTKNEILSNYITLEVI